MLRKINKEKFIKAYYEANDDNLSEKQVAKNGGMNYSYLHATLSIGQGTKRVSEKLARRIGRGLGMSKQLSTSWVNNLLSNVSTSTITGTTNKGRRPAKIEQPKHLPIIFYPVNKPSELAESIKNIMGNKHISLRSLAKSAFLNKRRMHDIFDGSVKTVPYLTCVRIADGLDISPRRLYRDDYYKPIIKEKSLFEQVKPDDNTASLDNKIELLNDSDKKMVSWLVDRLITAEKNTQAELAERK